MTAPDRSPPAVSIPRAAAGLALALARILARQAVAERLGREQDIAKRKANI